MLGDSKRTPRVTRLSLADRKNGKRPFTRAEALMAMLESNGCPVEQLQTLKNTVANQEVRHMTEDEHEVEKST